VEERGRIERGHERRLATVFGTVTVRRLACRAPGQPNVYPADAALSLPKGRHSHGLRRLPRSLRAHRLAAPRALQDPPANLSGQAPRCTA
jgi:hypothetical protein